MKRVILLFGLGLVLLACSRMEIEREPENFISEEIVFTAYANSVETKTERQSARTEDRGDGRVFWTPGDAVSLFFNQGDNGGDRFVAQNTEVSAIAEFKGTITGFAGGGESTGGQFWFWGVYPYSEDNSCDGASVTLTLSAQQTAKAGTFANGLFPTMARSQGLSLGFYNICGGLIFNVSRDDIKAIKFRGNANEELAGKAKVIWDSNGHPAVSEHLDGCKEVTVTAPNNGTFVPGIDYYIVLYPELLSEGFTLTFVTSASKQGSYNYSKSLQLKRGTFVFGENLDTRVTTWTDVEDSSGQEPSGSEGGTESGLYLGITYFGSELSFYPVRLLTEESVNAYNAYIDSKNELDYETLLYYAVDKAMSRLQSNKFPDDLFSASIVTFTDGQDDGSVGWKEDETGKTYYQGDYEKELATILEGSVQGIPVMSYSIGLKQSGISSNTAFINSLKTIAHPSTNYTLASNMTEVNETFGHIAQELSNTFKLNKLIGTIPRQASGTKIRFTYDNISNASNSLLFIEGIYRSGDYSLTDVVYTGMTSTSGSIVFGVRKNNKVTFTFEGVHRPNNTDISMAYFKRWIYNSDTSEWVEYKETSSQEGENGIAREIKSAVIILNLDCTQSLGESNFGLLKKYAKNFVSTLYQTSIDPEAVQKITLNKTSAEIPIGGNTKLTATIIPSTAIEKGVIWSSSNPDIASVDANGKVQANALGNTTITATSKDGGKTASCVITVFQPVNSISITSTVSEMEVGDKIALKATILPENASNKQISWSSSDDSIVFVNNEGYATAVKGGSATIYATSTDGTNIVANYPLFVNQHVEGISFEQTSDYMCLYDKKTLTPVFVPSSATYRNVSWSSSNSEVVSVSQTGELIANNVGIADISVITEDGGCEAVCQVEVLPAIDLGLSVCWATYNVGGSKQEDYGNYYAWGEVSTKSSYLVSNYKWISYVSETDMALLKYNNKSNWGIVDNKYELDLSDDAAYVNKGNRWRTPSSAEWQELINNCNWVWKTIGGHAGYLVTSKKEGFTSKSIFIPAAGGYDSILRDTGTTCHYWANNIYTPLMTYCFGADISTITILHNYGQFLGFSVRAVLNK